MVQSLSILRKKQQSSNAQLVLTPYTISFGKCKNMKIILKNAGAKCTTIKQQTLNTIFNTAATYKEANPLNITKKNLSSLYERKEKYWLNQR